jgi:HPt (histidine-containing phosphotransfer) domain-containing protein
MIALATSALPEQQRELVRCLVSEGRPPEEAAKLAGYHPKSVYRTLRLPAVAAAISESIQLDLTAIGAPLAYRVAKSLLQDEQVSARVRADLSIKILDRAGHIAPTRKESPAQKALSEMSRDELASFIDRNQAEIDKIEGELAARATDVSPKIAEDPSFLA